MTDLESISPLFTSVRPYITKLNSLDYQANELFYVIDNNVLSDFAKLANADAQHFENLIHFLKEGHENVGFILPKIILEESIRNVNTQQHFMAVYLNFYAELSKISPLYVLTLQDCFDKFDVLEGNIEIMDSFSPFLRLSKELNNDPRIINRLERAGSADEIEALYCENTDDAGERVAFLMCHAFVASRKKVVRFLSNEIEGVYVRWAHLLSESETIHELVHVSDEAEYCRLFKVESYHKLLYKFVGTIAEESALTFLHNARNYHKIANRPIRYCKNDMIKYQILTNEELIQIAKNQESKLFY